MTDTTLLVWQLRIEETEGLLKARQSELQTQLTHKVELEGQLQALQKAEVDLQCKLLQQQEQLARARHLVLSDQQQLQKLQDSLQQGQELNASQLLALEAQAALERTREIMAGERRRMQQLRDACADPDGEIMGDCVRHREAVARLTARLTQVETGMPALRAQLDCSHMECQLQEAKERLSKVQGQCTAQRCSLQQVQSSTQQVEQQVQTAQARLRAIQAYARVQHLKANVAAAQQEQAGLQSQLDGMDAWLQSLRSQGGLQRQAQTCAGQS